MAGRLVEKWVSLMVDRMDMKSADLTVEQTVRWRVESKDFRMVEKTAYSSARCMVVGLVEQMADVLVDD